MNFDGIFNLIDIIVLGYGFYAMYSAYVLRNEGKIIRPAYKYVGHHKEYRSVEEREA